MRCVRGSRRLRPCCLHARTRSSRLPIQAQAPPVFARVCLDTKLTQIYDTHRGATLPKGAPGIPDTLVDGVGVVRMKIIWGGGVDDATIHALSPLGVGQGSPGSCLAPRMKTLGGGYLSRSHGEKCLGKA